MIVSFELILRPHILMNVNIVVYLQFTSTRELVEFDLHHLLAGRVYHEPHQDLDIHVSTHSVHPLHHFQICCPQSLKH